MSKSKIEWTESNGGFEVADHLVEVTEVVQGGSGVANPYPSFALSRNACYLTKS